MQHSAVVDAMNLSQMASSSMSNNIRCFTTFICYMDVHVDVADASIFMLLPKHLLA